MTGFNSKRMMAREVDQSRLEALILKAGTDSSGKWMSIDNVEKLAELIVQECCTALESTDRYRSDYFIAKIREHFGVEESSIDKQLRNRSTYFGNNP
jgi:hypothetical protein